MRCLEKKYFILFFAFIIIISIFLTSANAANWYVDKDATGSGSGTSWENAWLSFSAIAWSSINAGDTIYISGGPTSKTYNEQLTVGKSGAGGNVITISTGQDAGHNGTVIINGGNYARNYGISIAGKSYIKVSGRVGTSRKMQLTGAAIAGLALSDSISYVEIEFLEINNNGNAADRDGISARIVYSPNYHSSIHDCDVHDNYQDGMNLRQSTKGEASEYGAFLIYNNIIRNFNDDGIEMSIGADVYNNEIGPRTQGGGNGHPDGIQFYNSYTRVFNNYFHGQVITSSPGTSNANIFYDPFTSFITLNPKYVQIYNNLIEELQPPGTGDVHRGIAVKFSEPGVLSANNILVANNTLVGIPFFGLQITFGPIGTANVSGVVIENNIFKDVGSLNPVAMILDKGNGTITYGSHGAGTDVVVDYNLVYASLRKYTTSVQWGGTTYSWGNYKSASKCDSHGVLGDPMFNRTYGLNSGSSAIDAGVALSSYFTTDKRGTPRPQGSAWDIGAYEGASFSLKPNSASDIQVR